MKMPLIDENRYINKLLKQVYNVLYEIRNLKQNTRAKNIESVFSSNRDSCFIK